MAYKFNDLERPPRARGVSKYQEILDMVEKTNPGDTVSIGFDTEDEARKAALSIRRHITIKYPKKTFSISSRNDMLNVWITRRIVEDAEVKPLHKPKAKKKAKSK